LSSVARSWCDVFSKDAPGILSCLQYGVLIRSVHGARLYSAGPKSEMNFFLFSICKEQTTGLCCYARITRHHGRFGVVVSTLMDRLQDSCAYFMLAQQLTVSLGYRIIGKKWQSVPMLDYTSIGPSGCRRANYNEPSTCQTIASTKIASIA